MPETPEVNEKPAEKEKPPRRLQEIEVLVESDQELEEIPVARVVKEPMIHQVGRNALGFALAFMAERLANVTYDKVLSLYRQSRKPL